MSKLNAVNFSKDERNTKVIQFGLSKFVKATSLFVVDAMNDSGLFDAGVTIVLPNAGIDYSSLVEQDYLYTVLLQGLLDGEEFVDSKIVSCVNNVVNPFTNFNSYLALAREQSLEFIFVNTEDIDVFYDEADVNLKAPSSFITQLLALLKARFEAFGGDITKGFHFIPTNKGYFDGEEIKEKLIKLAKQLRLSMDFVNWITYSNTYAKCFIDRMVDEASAEELENFDAEYEGHCGIRTEHFYTWVIEGSLGLDKVFPAHEATDVEFVDDIMPYLERSSKLRCGSKMALLASKLPTLNEAYEKLEGFVKDYIEYEAGPTIDLVDVELEFYADSLYERYANPFFKQKASQCCMVGIQRGLLPVILNSETLAKRAILILANYVIDFDLDLTSKPEYMKIDEIDGATAFLNECIEEIKANGFLAAVEKFF